MTYETRSARDGFAAGGGAFAALTRTSTLMGRPSILTLSSAFRALWAWSDLKKVTVAVPRLRPVGPYAKRIFLGLPTPIAVMKYSYKVRLVVVRMVKFRKRRGREESNINESGKVSRKDVGSKVARSGVPLREERQNPDAA